MLSRRDFGKLIPACIMSPFLVSNRETSADELISVGIDVSYDLPIFVCGQIMNKNALELEFAGDVTLSLVFNNKELVYKTITLNKKWERIKEYPLDIRRYKKLNNFKYMSRIGSSYYKLNNDSFNLIIDSGEKKHLCRLTKLKLISIKNV